MLNCHTVSYFGLPYYHNNNVYNVIAIFKAGASIPLATYTQFPQPGEVLRRARGRSPQSLPHIVPKRSFCWV